MASVSLSNLIAQEANAQGVPPAIALAVAQKESSVSQWRGDRSLVTGRRGNRRLSADAGNGRFLGRRPDRPDAEHPGRHWLPGAALSEYGDWTKALSAYNSGSPTGSPSTQIACWRSRDRCAGSTSA